MQQHTRREKSLSLLCQKFLSFYPVHVNPDERIVICLDHMAQLLEVERRRIYDIVNVLESVEILSRFCKNQYLWHGFSKIPHTLSKLKTLSLKSNFLEYTKALMASQLETSIDLYQDTKQALNVCFESNYNSANGNSKVNLDDMKDATTQTISISREEKSLGIMSQKFLMLFLTSEDGLVSINFAARVLLGDTKNDTTELGRFKTKIRRLYDIANVLTSISLIKKYHFNDVNISKPAYKYIGPDVDVIRDAEFVFDFMNSGNPLSNSKHSLFDHFKRNLDLECSIPKFDVNTGILTSKDKKWKKQSSSTAGTKASNRQSNSPSDTQSNSRYQPYPISLSSSHQFIDQNNQYDFQDQLGQIQHQNPQPVSAFPSNHELVDQNPNELSYFCYNSYPNDQSTNIVDYFSYNNNNYCNTVPNGFNNSSNTNAYYGYNPDDSAYYFNNQFNQYNAQPNETQNHSLIDTKPQVIGDSPCFESESAPLPSFNSFLN